MLAALLIPPCAKCSYCSNEALTNTYPIGPECPVPVCGACLNR